MRPLSLPLLTFSTSLPFLDTLTHACRSPRTAKENVPAVKEPVAPVVAAEEPAAAPAVAAAESSDDEHKEKKEKHDRPKSPGVFDKCVRGAIAHS